MTTEGVFSVEAKKVTGRFWLPGHEAVSQYGTLVFDTESGAQLELFDELVEQESETVNQSTWGEVRDRIFGAVLSGGKEIAVTLMDCIWLSPVKYSANALLWGGLFAVNDTSFETAIVRLHNLPQWVADDFISVEVDEAVDGVERRELRSLVERPASVGASFSAGELRLDYRWSYDVAEYDQLLVRQWPQFELRYKERQSLQRILQDVGSLETLLTICADAASDIISVFLYRSDMPEQALSGRVIEGTQRRIELGARFGVLDRKKNRKTKSPHRMLISLKGLGGIGAVAAWLDKAADLRGVVGSLVTMRADIIFSENRFLNVVSAAEGFHRATIGGAYMERVEWKKIKRALKQHLDEAHHVWFDNCMRHSNDPSLNQRLRDLVGLLGENANVVTGDTQAWSRIVSTCRNNLTHLEGDRETYEAEHLYWLAESVFNVTRIALLLHIGMPSRVMPTVLRSWPVSATESKVRTAIESLRDVR